MIRKSVEFVRLGPEILQASVVQEDPGVMKLKRMPNSIDTLSPNDPFVKIMNALPLAKGVPYHSIIGDRGRGDTPNSSDGVVPYWSSHVGGAKSEKIVPSGHGANQHPKGIAEVVRILKEHIESKGLVTKRQPRISTLQEPAGSPALAPAAIDMFRVASPSRRRRLPSFAPQLASPVAA